MRLILVVLALLFVGSFVGCLDDPVDPRPGPPAPEADGGSFDPDRIGYGAGGSSGYGSGSGSGSGSGAPIPRRDQAVDADTRDAGPSDAELDGAMTDITDGGPDGSDAE